MFGNLVIKVSKRLGFTNYAIYLHEPSCHLYEHAISRSNYLNHSVIYSWFSIDELLKYSRNDNLILYIYVCYSFRCMQI